MPDQDQPTGPLSCAVSFPPDERFAPTAGDLAAKLASTCGCGEAAVQDVRETVRAAFSRVALGAGARGGAVDIACQVTDAALDVVVSCGTETLLHLTHLRPA
ncbi:MAG: hypothetical protein NTY02_03130 [Acidobacteria bacterium]|nr:hypothetical protein [Acidobacteriota bacterium]